RVADAPHRVAHDWRPGQERLGPAAQRAYNGTENPGGGLRIETDLSSSLNSQCGTGLSTIRPTSTAWPSRHRRRLQSI
ncbi:MAG: hypothetical protein ACK55I_33910, partial [bacterium]